MQLSGQKRIIPLPFFLFNNFYYREVPEVIMSSVFVLSACAVVLIGLAVIAAEEPFK